MVRLKNALKKCYLVFILLFLYAPIFVLIVLSFNSSRSRVTWGGFTLEWYGKLFSSRRILEALQTTLILGFASAAIATIIGTLGAVGIQIGRAHV